MEIISSKQEEEFKATTFVVNIVKLHSNPKVLFKSLYMEFRNFDSERFRHTVEPRLTTTSLIRPPRYYDHFFLARQNARTFSYKNTPLMRPPRLCDQRPLF